jgi:multidrug efflux pump subunit AcrA (membrane-fusion protein)
LYATAAILAVILTLVIFMIAKKIIQSSEKSRVPVYTVGGSTLKTQDVEVIYRMNGNAEGDPQVMTYPQLSGKFNRYTVAEGEHVKKGEIIAYIDRDIAGGGYELEPVKAAAGGLVLRLFYRDRGAKTSTSSPIAETGDDSTIKISVSVGSGETEMIKKGMPARVFPAGGLESGIEASVDSVTPFVSGDNYEGRIIIKAPNPEGKIKIGMNLNIEVSAGTKRAFMVLERAVLLGQNRSFVFVNDGGTARERVVKTGYISGDYIEISGDIREGEQIVVNGAFMINDGARIDFRNESSQKLEVKSQK